MKKLIIVLLAAVCTSVLIYTPSCQASAQRILLLSAQDYSAEGSAEQYRQIDKTLAQNFNYPLNNIVPHYEMLPIFSLPPALQAQPRTAKLPKEFLQEISKTARADFVLIPQLIAFRHYTSTDFYGDTIQYVDLKLRCFVYTAADDQFSVIETSRYYHDEASPGNSPSVLLDEMLRETNLKSPYGIIADAKKHGVQAQ